MTTYIDVDANLARSQSERVAELVTAGYTVGESEDIAEHDDGWHDAESVPDCPRCEEYYDDEEYPTRYRSAIALLLDHDDYDED